MLEFRKNQNSSKSTDFVQSMEDLDKMTLVAFLADVTDGYLNELNLLAARLQDNNQPEGEVSCVSVENHDILMTWTDVVTFPNS